VSAEPDPAGPLVEASAAARPAPATAGGDGHTDSDAPVVEPGGWRYTLPGGLLRTARPRQWLKNILVFAAPGAAGISLDPVTLAPVLGAFAAWCLVSSGTYFLNDALDVAADRLHPRKRLRAVPAGLVPVVLAKVVGVCLIVAGVGLPLAWGAGGVTVVIATYAVVTISYSLWLKDEPVIDLAAVASGFVLRAISGGVAAGVPISNWFLIVASFGSLFMVAGKRHAEHVDLRDDRGAHRATLAEYSLGYLRYVRSVSSSVAITAYCLWAFEKADAAHSGFLFQLSIVPFVIAILRYALILDAGRGGAPEEIVLGDRTLQVLGVVWVALFAVGVYAR
jgi:decaprenyl-phosphate phosphoribosyltransferase